MTNKQKEFMAQFKEGQRVEIIGSNYHTDVVGKIAYVTKVIKTKMELCVLVEGGFYPERELAKEPDERHKYYEYYPNAENVRVVD